MVIAERTTPAVPVDSVLSRAPNPELRKLNAIETEDSVTLIGQVSCYYMKQLAQELIRSVAQGRQIINRVIVAHRDPTESL
jgi:hypothetical protein